MLRCFADWAVVGVLKLKPRMEVARGHTGYDQR